MTVHTTAALAYDGCGRRQARQWIAQAAYDLLLLAVFACAVLAKRW